MRADELPSPPIDGEQQDSWLFGWDPTPGIVSVWADPAGRALVWRRSGEIVSCDVERFRPWIFAAGIEDLAHLGSGLHAAADALRSTAPVAYQELSGPYGTYRYLISGRSWRILERALLEGAARRYGRPVASLYDLDEYYRVGLVEQYLMQSGRVYFRGLAYDDLHRMQLDLETTGLDPHNGRIFMVAVRDSRGLATTLDAPEPEDEPRLIEQLCALIRDRDPDVIENHNLFGFDLPFLEARAALHRIPLRIGRAGAPDTLERIEDPAGWGSHGRRRVSYTVAGRELVDTLEAVRRYDFSTRELPSYRLKDVARHFGVAPPDRVYLPGAAIFDTYRHSPELVRHYALDDVAEVDGLSRRLSGAAFALAGMAPRRYCRLVTAGPAMGILEPMLVRAYLRERAALPRGPEERADMAGHAGGAVHLFASGVAEHVVKTDIASMYPSVMRTYRIGPASDRLGVLLHLVGRLTDLRLAHKEAARRALPGSLQAGHHTALQLAMKIMVNSAYGYLGAGRMALFADRAAADEVTRRGREILDQVVGALRERGMVLLEADTDGVFFAAPPSWDEQRERALVEDVGGELPPGLRLEYEGRYQAMFSYEVKNYALLTYDGEIIVRGAALRSSRSEPFGERFLQQALHALMRGDTAALGRIFRATTEALRERRLPAADVATRVRLTKTPEEYARSRSSHREAAYEALLAAGKTEWRPGERIRFYRAESGAAVWLPDLGDEGESSADERRDYDVEHYLQVLLTSYAGRLRKAFAPADFDQLFRIDNQLGLFDLPVDSIQPQWIRCAEQSREP